MLKPVAVKQESPCIIHVFINMMHKYIKGPAFKNVVVKLGMLRNMSLSFKGNQGDMESIPRHKASIDSSIKIIICVPVALI